LADRLSLAVSRTAATFCRDRHITDGVVLVPSASFQHSAASTASAGR
jgi:hypothetical protein